jgi:type II secretory pathway component PulF
LSALLESGVPIRRALGFAAVASADAEVERRILIARGRIASGESLAAALSRERALTPVALRLLAAGEESGRLAGMLGHAAKLEQERSDRMLRSAVKLVEPALIMVFAGLIGFVAAALLQAVYAVRPT